MSRLDKEDSLQAGAIRLFHAVIFLQVVVKIDHFFNSLIKLGLVLEIQHLSSVLELGHLVLHMIKHGLHLVLVALVLFGDRFERLFELLLVLQIDHGLIFNLFELPTIVLRYCPVPLGVVILLVEKALPL